MADLAREEALKYFRQNIDIDEKDDKTPVTQADRIIESRLREFIRREFPSHGIIGEEYGKENTHAEFVWVIDPIDGTKSFAIGRPLFGTVIGLVHQGKPVVGLIEQAFTKERWFGVTNQSCTHNGKPIKIASPRELKDARFYSGPPSMFHDCRDSYETLSNSVKWIYYGGNCYAYGLLAMGWIDLVMERDLDVFDIMGLIPIIKGAGGYVCSWDKKEIDLSTNGSIVAASSEKLAMDALSIIKQNV